MHFETIAFATMHLIERLKETMEQLQWHCKHCIPTTRWFRPARSCCSSSNHILEKPAPKRWGGQFVVLGPNREMTKRDFGLNAKGADTMLV